MSALASTLIGAGLLLGQVGGVSHGMPPYPGPTPTIVSHSPAAAGPVRGLFERLFRSRRHAAPGCECGSNVAPAAFNKAVAPVVPYTPVSHPVITPAAHAAPAAPQNVPVLTVEGVPEGPLVLPAAKDLIQQAAAPAGERTTGPILPALVNKMGRDDKFTWITGQLEVEDGKTVLYYGTPDLVDPCRGRVTLQTDADLSKLAQGDLVSATGRLQGAPGPGAVYVATSVTLIESPWHAGK